MVRFFKLSYYLPTNFQLTYSISLATTVHMNYFRVSNSRTILLQISRASFLFFFYNGGKKLMDKRKICAKVALPGIRKVLKGFCHDNTT